MRAVEDHSAPIPEEGNDQDWMDLFFMGGDAYARGDGGSLVLLLLAERLRSECARFREG